MVEQHCSNYKMITAIFGDFFSSSFSHSFLYFAGTDSTEVMKAQCRDYRNYITNGAKLYSVLPEGRDTKH